MNAAPMTAEQRPFVPMLRCPKCQHADRTTVCHQCLSLKLPKSVRPYASELAQQEVVFE